MRASKTEKAYNVAADGTKTLAQTTVVKYYYVNGQLHFQETVTQKPGEAKTTDEHYFYYDSNGYLTAIGHKGGIYYAATNQRGDVVALYYADGRIMGRYEYDAWGNIIKIEDISYDSGGDQIIKDVTNNTTSTDLVVVNPIRYRGYYYDSETKLYYLQSRYYNAAVGRFLNADAQISGVGGDMLGYNVFAYCMNNPVNANDPTGNWPNWGKLIAGISIGFVGMAAVATVATGGCAAPLLAAAVAVAGAACMAMGSSEIVESFTGYNMVREEVFNGNEKAYNVTRTAVSTVASVGTSSYPVCFVAGTSVLIRSGLKNIEDIEIGDLVWAEDPETGEKCLKTVVQTFVNKTNELVHVFVSGEEIITTPEHPFYVPQKGWTSSIKLRAGDILVLQSGGYVVEKIQHEILETPITVYNFEVEDFHTYYVGDSSVLVHNECKVSTQKLNPTHELTASRTEMQKLISDIKNNGIKESVKYVTHGGSKYIVDGHHRVAAAKILGIMEVPATEVQLPYGSYKTEEDLLW